MNQGATYTSGGLPTAAGRARHCGHCYDNAVAESFFCTLKNELVHERDYHTREDARAGDL